MARSRRRAGGPAGGVDVALLRRALEEDRFEADLTTRSLFAGPFPARGDVVAQAQGVLSGSHAAVRLARLAGLTARRKVADGRSVRRGTVVLELRGDGRRILAVERTLLNLLMHLSGVATATRTAVEAVRGAGGTLHIRGTRKTLPGLRDLEKAAIEHGGGERHRRDLASGILVKNNHLEALPVAEAVRRLRRLPFPRPVIEVEVRTLTQARQALAAGAEELLLDNLSPRGARRLVSAIRRLPKGQDVPIELSGGLTVGNVREYARTGADSASLGSLTHSAPALPFHMKLTALGGRPPP
ncbi:MAG TPA: carboxylating nicotinate-nucleotide diphosphorylase [Thermoplasmata archaeon]|nr:carboxylating nicotinate-nucleotide diphosphorylase [Thermoplasmata archaeon]